MEATSSYAKGGPMKQMKAEKQVNLGEAVIICTAMFTQ
jgi:hypothetical protein